MNACDFNAYTHDGAVYCVGCLPDGVDPNGEEVSPIFGDAEWDYYPTCDACGYEHDYVSLTTEGAARLAEDEMPPEWWIEDKHSGAGESLFGSFDDACRAAVAMCGTDTARFVVWSLPDSNRAAEASMRGVEWRAAKYRV